MVQVGLTCNHRRPCKLEARETDYGGEGVLPEWHEDGVMSPGVQVTSPFSRKRQGRGFSLEPTEGTRPANAWSFVC